MRQDVSSQGSGLFFPLMIALGAHFLGFWLLWFGWQQSSVVTSQRVPKIDPREIISAVAVQQDPIEALRQKQQAEAAAKAQAQAERERQRQLEARRKEEARQQALVRQREEQARQREAQRLQREREAAAKREAERKAAEQARQAKLKREQQLKAEQARKQEEARRQEEARKQEVIRKQEEQRRREAQLAAAKAQKEALAAAEAEKRRQEIIDAERRSLQAALDREAAFLSELEDREQLASMQMLIKGYVEQNWSRPPTARKGMEAILRIELLPTGEVKSVTVVNSSNDNAFDRSAEQAVYRAGPFRELQDLKPHQRDAFRAFNLVFKPKDIQ